MPRARANATCRRGSANGRARTAPGGVGCAGGERRGGAQRSGGAGGSGGAAAGRAVPGLGGGGGDDAGPFPGEEGEQPR